MVVRKWAAKKKQESSSTCASHLLQSVIGFVNHLSGRLARQNTPQKHWAIPNHGEQVLPINIGGGASVYRDAGPCRGIAISLQLEPLFIKDFFIFCLWV